MPYLVAFMGTVQLLHPLESEQGHVLSVWQLYISQVASNASLLFQLKECFASLKNSEDGVYMQA
jgi:hypothetical protein